MGIQIAIEDLNKVYEKGPERVHVLKGIGLTIAAGDQVAVTGVSGAGKSTLLHILGTLDRPSAGRVHFDGEAVFARSAPQLDRLRNERIGFVFQFHHLIDEFNAIENAAMPLLIRGLPRGRAMAAATEALEQVGLGHRLDHRPTQLSGGELQRVAIARALVGRPDLVLMDEPTGNLDTGTAEEIHELIWAITEATGATLVVVTHNMGLADRMSSRYHLEDGRLVA